MKYCANPFLHKSIFCLSDCFASLDVLCDVILSRSRGAWVESNKMAPILGEKKGCPTMGYEWYTSKMPNIQLWKMMITLKYLKTNIDYFTKGCVRDMKLHDGTLQTSQNKLVFPQMGPIPSPAAATRFSPGIKFGVGNGCLGSPCGWDCWCLGSVTKITHKNQHGLSVFFSL